MGDALDAGGETRDAVSGDEERQARGAVDRGERERRVRGAEREGRDCMTLIEMFCAGFGAGLWLAGGMLAVVLALPVFAGVFALIGVAFRVLKGE